MFGQEAIHKFVLELKEEGVFAKEVRSAGVAFHSYYMASIAPALLEALKKVNLVKTGVLLQLVASVNMFFSLIHFRFFFNVHKISLVYSYACIYGFCVFCV